MLLIADGFRHVLPLGVQGVLARLAAADQSWQGADLETGAEESILVSPQDFKLRLLPQGVVFKEVEDGCLQHEGTQGKKENSTLDIS